MAGQCSVPAGRSPGARVGGKTIRESPIPSALRLRCIEVMRMNLDARWQKSPTMRKSCARNISLGCPIANLVVPAGASYIPRRHLGGNSLSAQTNRRRGSWSKGLGAASTALPPRSTDVREVLTVCEPLLVGSRYTVQGVMSWPTEYSGQAASFCAQEQTGPSKTRGRGRESF